MKINDDIKQKSRITSEEWKEWTKTVWNIANVSDPVHPAVFPSEIPLRLIKMFSFFGETVLDPFSGTATTGCVAIQNGRKYIGFETNKQFCDESINRLKHTICDNPEYSIINHTSETMNELHDDSVGVIVTSPPYWNKADYGDYPDNLGSEEYYDVFLDDMKKVMKECYRVLIPGRKMCIVTANVNQNTKEYGLITIPIASDLIKIAQSIGFVLINQIIWNKDGTGGKWGSSKDQRPIFGSYPYPPNFLFKNVNEHIIIVQKPDPKKCNKAPSYTELFQNKEMS